jgi:hypothetical protein
MKRGASLIVMTCLAGSLAGCSSMPWTEHDAQLYSPVNGQVGEGQSGLKPDDKLSIGDIPVCLDKPGSVTITKVEPVGAMNGMTVVAFAVRTIPDGTTPMGAAIGDLTAMGVTPAEQQQREVSNVCGAQSRANLQLQGPPPAGTEERRVEVDVSVIATTLPASSQAFRILYRDASGDERSTLSNIALTMCGGKVVDPCVPK